MRGATVILFTILIVLVAFSYSQQTKYYNQPISDLIPSDGLFNATRNPWVNPNDLYAYNETKRFPPTNTWWMNLIMQGGTGFYSLTVVDTPANVTDASKQISQAEMISLGYNVTTGSIVQITRDIFDPNNNQGCFFILGSPVGFRFSQQELITNNSNEYRANRDWSFQVSSKETVLFNPQVGPPFNSSYYWSFKATSWSDLSVTLRYNNSNNQGFLYTTQTRFSPYQTFHYEGTAITPAISLVGAISFTSISGFTTQPVSGWGASVTDSQFIIVMSDGSEWLVFATTTITLTLATSSNYLIIPDGEPLPPNPNNFQYLYQSQSLGFNPPLTPAGTTPQLGFEYQYFPTSYTGGMVNALVSSAPWTGTIRIAKIPNAALGTSMQSEIQTLLTSFAYAIPVEGVATITESQDSNGEISQGYQFNYTSATMYNPTGTNPSSPLLLFAYPPYLITDISSSSTSVALYTYPSLYTNRGYLQYLSFQPSSNNSLQFQVPVLADEYFSSSVKFLPNSASSLTQDDIDTLIDQLAYDQKWVNVTTYYDTYAGGKEMLLKAELNLYYAKVLADQNTYQNSSIQQDLLFGLNQTKWSLTHWLNGNSFYYDEDFGGIIATWGMFNPGNDFGNVMYQDHNFHYGYFIQAASIVAYLDTLYPPENGTRWVDEKTWSGNGTNADLVNCLIRETINPSSNDASFPTWRLVDWEEGHSRPMGLYPTGSGGNEESTAEDMNFYYGIMRWGNVTQNAQLNRIGNVMASRLSKAAKYLWQVASSMTIYEGSQQNVPMEPPSGVNYFPCVGIIWDGKADPNTWFEGTDYCEVGIQSITTIPSMLEQLEDYMWVSRMIDYWVPPTQSNNTWHIWSIPEDDAIWYSILMPLLSIDYPSATRIMYNDDRVEYDSGNSPGTILFDILYFQAAKPMYVGPYPTLRPASTGYPINSTGFEPIAAKQQAALEGPLGPIVAYSKNLNATASMASLNQTIVSNSIIIGVTDPYKTYPTPQSWTNYSIELQNEFVSFRSAYNDQVNITSNMSPSDSLASWQQFAATWLPDMPPLSSVSAIQQECVDEMNYLNEASNLCVANSNALSTMISRVTLDSCISLLQALANEYGTLTVYSFPPSSQSDIMIWSELTLYDPDFEKVYPALKVNSVGASCINDFCDYSFIKVPPKFQNLNNQ